MEINLIKSRPDIDQKQLKYHWTLEGAGLKPVGFVNDMRRPAYRAAQDARDALGDKQDGLILSACSKLAGTATSAPRWPAWVPLASQLAPSRNGP